MMLVRLSFEDGMYTIAVRDFDVRTQLLGPVLESRVFHPARLPDAILQELVAAFAPLARSRKCPAKG